MRGRPPESHELDPIEIASRDEIAALQLARLKATLHRAYARVPHYRAAFEQAGVHPDDLRELADLARFPFTTKDDLRRHYPFGMLAVPRAEVVRIIWGKIGLQMDPPRALAGAVNLGFMMFPSYRLLVLGITALVLVALWLFLTRTNLGLIIRAGSRDSLMVRALGIDVGRIWLIVFGIGTALAGLGGVLAGPMRSVSAGPW